MVHFFVTLLHEEYHRTLENYISYQIDHICCISENGINYDFIIFEGLTFCINPSLHAVSQMDRYEMTTFDFYLTDESSTEDDTIMCCDLVESVGSQAHWLWDITRKRNDFCPIVLRILQLPITLQPLVQFRWGFQHNVPLQVSNQVGFSA